MLSADPGRIGAYFHYIHAILVAGIIATAVGNDLVLAHSHEGLKTADALILAGGPALYLLGSAVYRKVVYGGIPISHITGLAILIGLIPFAPIFDLLTMGWLTTIVMLTTGFWEGRIVRRWREGSKP